MFNKTTGQVCKSNNNNIKNEQMFLVHCWESLEPNCQGHASLN